MSEIITFVQNLRDSFTSVGAVLPTSRYAARVMASEFARRAGPRRVLEAGPGTGPITAAIISAMRPDDHLTLYELNDGYVAYLRQRFEQDPAFRRVRDQVTLVHGDITQIDRTQRFDAIISAIPMTNLPADLVERILATYAEILEPDGTLTYIEYAYLRRLKQLIQNADARAATEAASSVLDRYLAQYEFRRDTEVRNVPPAWVHHLRLNKPTPHMADALRPLAHTRRIGLGPTGLNTEALPWIGGAIAAGAILPEQVRGLRWGLAAAIGAFFRDPPRHIVPNADIAYAASDGRVLHVERLVDTRFGPGEWLRIAVFLSLLDVHINRSPIAGQVHEVIAEPGGFAKADHAAAEHNQAQYTVIEGPAGRCIVAQRTGMVARRIVGWNKPGDLLAQGDRFGLIRFGSRTDVYLPADRWHALVQPGDRVVGGETPLAQRR